MKKIILPIGLLTLMVYSSCGHHNEGHAHERTKFKVTGPLRMDTSITKDYVCQVRSVQHIELRALERGYLESIFVDEGEFVKKGQKMFQIMPLIYQAELRSAQAEVDFAEIEYQNTKALADSNIVSANELALAKATLDKARAELSMAEVHLGFTEIRAPFDGIMDRLHVRQGSLLEEGELLTELSDNSEMWVYFNVPEVEYLEYMKHSKEENETHVRLKMANGEIFPHVGEITTIEADFDSKTGNIAFRATFPNPDALLRHGETGNILMDSDLKDVLLIPQKTTFEVLDQRYVFLIDDENIARMTRVGIAAELPHLFAIEDGLKEGDRILLDGLRKVRNDEEVETTYMPPDSVFMDLELYAE